MVVYADILMLVNFVVDYFLLRLASKFLHRRAAIGRTLLSAAIGGICSLYIFVPKTNFFIETVIHIFICATLSVVAWKFESIKVFLRSTVVLVAVNFAYSGAMIAVWLVFKPYGMVINNSVVYFNVSPMFLIAFSVIGYFLTIALQKLLKKKFAQNTFCDVTLVCEENSVRLKGIVDTGNSLKDAFGLSQIFITDQEIVDMVLQQEKNNPTRLRKVPCGTIVGNGLLDGYRIDNVKINFENKDYEFKNAVLAISNERLVDCKLIVNPESLNI